MGSKISSGTPGAGIRLYHAVHFLCNQPTFQDLFPLILCLHLLDPYLANSLENWICVRAFGNKLSLDWTLLDSYHLEPFLCYNMLNEMPVPTYFNAAIILKQVVLKILISTGCTSTKCYRWNSKSVMGRKEIFAEYPEGQDWMQQATEINWKFSLILNVSHVYKCVFCNSLYEWRSLLT